MSIDIYELVTELIGDIDPIGETNTDNMRYERLKRLTSLAEHLLTDICRIEHEYKNNHQYSMKRASEHCAEFLDTNGIHE